MIQDTGATTIKQTGGGAFEPARYSTLLVATDGSACSLRAGEQAVSMARSFGTSLLVLNVVDVGWAFLAGIHYGEAMDELARFGVEATGAVAELAERAGVEHREMVVQGHPAATIIEVAREVGVDAVILGSEGSSRLEHAVLGSVSEEVLRHADRPVFVVGGPTKAASSTSNAIAGGWRLREDALER